MGKLLVHQFVSLDGYAADAGGDFSLFDGGDVTTPEFDLELLVRLQLVDAILLGATTYRMFADYWPTPASGNQLIAPTINSLEKIVFSRTLEDAPWGEFAPARVESGDAVEVIRALKEEKFGDLLVWGSLSLTDSLFAAGLVDSVRIAVLPVILGSGRSPFPNGFAERDIRLVDSHTFDVGIVASEYAVGHYAPVVTGAIEAPAAVPVTNDDVTSAATPSTAAADATSEVAPQSTSTEAWPVDQNTEAAVPINDEPSPYPEAWNVEHAAAWSGQERPGADLTGTDAADDGPEDNGAENGGQPQSSTDQTVSDEPAADDRSTDQASPAYPSPDDSAADSAASTPEASEQPASAISDPWQPPAAQSAPDDKHSNDVQSNDVQSNGDTENPDANADTSGQDETVSDGAGTAENFGTPEATENAGDDSASATNPAPDPAESEWLVSRRKWE